MDLYIYLPNKCIYNSQNVIIPIRVCGIVLNIHYKTNLLLTRGNNYYNIIIIILVRRLYRIVYKIIFYNYLNVCVCT